MLDFDNINEWAPKFDAALSGIVSNSVKSRLVAVAPKYIEDSRDLLFELTDRNAIIEEVLILIRRENIIAYHGSRLTDAEVASIQSSGLIPLKAEGRRQRLIRALSQHPKWLEVASKLDAVIQAHGQGIATGKREDQVHLTLSRSGLVRGFNHYLTHGSEFDQCVAHKLFGSDGVELLARDGKPRVIQIAVPGNFALDAAHPYFSIDDLRAKGDVPNIVDQFLEAWSYRLVHSTFQSRTLRIDCGMVFHSVVPSGWIVSFDTLQESELINESE